MNYRTIRTIHVDGAYWNGYFEGGEWLDRDYAVTDVSARANVHPCVVQDGVEYTVETCITDTGQRVRETIQIVDR